MKQIQLTQGKVALVDDTDYEYFNQWNWTASNPSGNLWYAVRSEKKKFIKMHREIMNAPKGMEIDHINGNGLDNRRSNLRVCTRAENASNHTKQINNTTGYKGVSIFREGNFVRYRANIRVRGKLLHLGLFKNPEEAARAYDKAATKHFGEFAKLNFEV